MANFGSVFMGTIAGMVGAGVVFYGITVRQALGGTTPVDSDETWQVKSEDMMIEGKWRREAAGPVHLNPIKYHISGRDYAMQVMQPAPKDDDEDEDEDDE